MTLEKVKKLKFTLSGSFRSSETRFDGIQVINNWDNCEVIQSTTFSIRKLPSSTDRVVKMIEEQRNVSKKPACIAYYAGTSDGNVKIQKMMFRMFKQ